jgi:hypothetical protein
MFAWSELKLNIPVKSFSLFGLFLFLNLQFFGQTITGKIVSASSNEPLIYASIGVIETSYGTITNENGNFNLDIKGLPVSSLVRFSIIGFKSRIFSIEELSDKDNIIGLESVTYNLPEVIVNPIGKPKKVGTTNYTLKGGFCGLAGTDSGKGYEIGTKLELGKYPVRLRTLNMHLFKQSFDSSLFRLHIRNIIDSLPGIELLNTNILIALTKESGWVDVDLSKYNLVFEGDIVLSLEWIKVIGVNKANILRINGQKQLTTSVLFNLKMNHGSMFSRWGTEAKWLRHERRSPSFYLTVQ